MFLFELRVVCLTFSLYSICVQSSVQLSRDNIVAVLGGTALFQCLTNRNEGPVDWLINDNHLGDIDDMNVVPLGKSLVFSNVLKRYNNTVVQCGVGDLRSGVATLFVQGLLSAVTDVNLTLQNSTVSLTWTAPFSLNITNVEHDITYCVDVVDSTSVSSLHSECGLMNTKFNFTIIPNSFLNFTITPVNLVGNGTQESAFLSLIPEIAASLTPAENYPTLEDDIQAKSEAESDAAIIVVVTVVMTVVLVVTTVVITVVGAVKIKTRVIKIKCIKSEPYENGQVCTSEYSVEKNDSPLRTSPLECSDGNSCSDSDVLGRHSHQLGEPTEVADQNSNVYHPQGDPYICTEPLGSFARIFVQGTCTRAVMGHNSRLYTAR